MYSLFSSEINFTEKLNKTCSQQTISDASNWRYLKSDKANFFSTRSNIPDGIRGFSMPIYFFDTLPNVLPKAKALSMIVEPKVTNSESGVSAATSGSKAKMAWAGVWSTLAISVGINVSIRAKPGLSLIAPLHSSKSVIYFCKSKDSCFVVIAVDCNIFPSQSF